jgi:hypothetical protein
MLGISASKSMTEDVSIISVCIYFEYRHISGGNITFFNVFSTLVDTSDIMALIKDDFPTSSENISYFTISKHK